LTNFSIFFWMRCEPRSYKTGVLQPSLRKSIGIIDGQGSGIGSTIIKKIKAHFGESIEIIALGTNAIATAKMIKAGANRGVSGENAIVRTVARVDVVIGTLGVF
jgi:hypothetical protein